MSIYLVRHALAVPRKKWAGRDDSRPLTPRGARQASALVELFDGERIDRIYSSPAVRCVETVRPLARHRTLAIKTAESLAEGSGRDGMALAGKAEHVVLCAHGDNLLDLLDALAGHLDVVGPDPDFAKGATWVLMRREGHVIDARYVEPPA